MARAREAPRQASPGSTASAAAVEAWVAWLAANVAGWVVAVAVVVVVAVVEGGAGMRASKWGGSCGEAANPEWTALEA